MKNLLTALALAVLLATSLARADHVRIFKPQGAASEALTLTQGESLRVIFHHFRTTGSGINAELHAMVDGETFIYNESSLTTERGSLAIVGPAELTVTGANDNYGFISFDRVPPSGLASGESIPGTIAVIPEEPAGDVRVILESSTDMLNWAAANPGIYGSSGPARFFRIRTERVETP